MTHANEWHLRLEKEDPMPFIEDVDDLAEALADAVGKWGSCPDGEKEGCEQETYCRTCWTIEIKQRMRAAVKREQGTTPRKDMP